MCQKPVTTPTPAIIGATMCATMTITEGWQQSSTRT